MLKLHLTTFSDGLIVLAEQLVGVDILVIIIIGHVTVVIGDPSLGSSLPSLLLTLDHSPHGLKVLVIILILLGPSPSSHPLLLQVLRLVVLH